MGLTQITALKKDHKVELVLLFLFILITISILFISCLFIPIIQDGRAYIPDQLDYLRTFILSSISAITINYCYRFISKITIVFKIPIEFLFFYLLAYPQTQEKSKTFSQFNLTTRQSFLFGVIYQTISLGFYYYDEIKFLVGLEKEDEKDLEQLTKINNIRSKSTLSNCLQIRRNSNSLRKILYPETFTKVQEPIDEYGDLIVSDGASIIEEQSTEPIRPIASYGSITSLFISQSNNQQLSELDTESRLLLKQKFKYQSFALQLIWIISSSFFEVGISLILSLPFIYVPGITDGHQFSSLQVYYYGKVGLFTLEIVSPLALLISAVYYMIYANFHSVYPPILGYVCNSLVLFVGGWYFS